MAVKTYPANYNYGTGASKAYATDHMRGVNNLPKYDAQASQRQANEIVERQLSEFRSKNNLPSKEQRNAMDRKAANKAPKGATIHADQPSDCFASLSWRDGVATMEFYRGGALVYDVEMSKSEFMDWAVSDSLGGYFNDVIR